MENKPSDDFGDHSQRVHDICQKDFDKYKECAETPTNQYGRAKDCNYLNYSFMHCLDKFEHSPRPCLGLLDNHRDCKFGTYKYWCERWMSIFKECKKDPKRFQEMHGETYSQGSTRPIS